MKLAHSNSFYSDVAVTSEEDPQIVDYNEGVHYYASVAQMEAVAEEITDDWQRDYIRMHDKHWSLIQQSNDLRYARDTAMNLMVHERVSKHLRQIEIKLIALENDIDVMQRNQPTDTIPF